MKLLLTSSGNTNKSIEKTLLDLLEKPFGDSSCVFIPTAANVEEDKSGWLENDINNFKKLHFKSFDVVDISEVSKEQWLPIFENADILVFGGGSTEYLREHLKKSGLSELLPKMLEKKVYVGISAGSMVTAKKVSLPSENLLYYEKYGNVKKIIDGLGYVNFEIRPHLNSEYFPKVRIDFLEKLASDTKISFYAIDDNTAVKVVDEKVEIVSEGSWKKFN